MVLGYVKGYDIKAINQKKALKPVLSDELKSLISDEELKEKMIKALSEEGRVYALYKKKEMVICYIFTKTRDVQTASENVSNDRTEEKSNDLEKEKDAGILTLSDMYVPQQHEQAVASFDKALKEELKEVLVLYNYKHIIFKDTKIEKKMYNTPLGTMSGIMIGVCIGILFGVALDNILLGLCMAISMALLYGVIFTENSKREGKNTDKANTKENSDENNEIKADKNKTDIH